MNKVFQIILLTLFFANLIQAGLIGLGLCYSGCNAVWVACVSAAGGVAGVSTGGLGVPAAIVACNTAQGVCMHACTVALALPI